MHLVYPNNKRIAGVKKAADRWLEYETEAIDNLADTLDDINSHPSRLIKLISFIDTDLFSSVDL